MQKALRSSLLVALLALLIPAAGRPVDPLRKCSLCSCATSCGTPCRQTDGTPSVCGINGHLCQISPVCSEP